MKYRAMLLVGPPGSGKGTLGRALSASSGLFHCSCGDVFRAMDSSSDVGRLFNKYASRGLLVPDEVTVNVWLAHVAQCEAENTFCPDRQVLLLDGIPRNANQARLMVAAVAVVGILHFDGVSHAELASRLQKRARKEGRIDDSQNEVIQRRLDLYEHEARDLLGHYQPECVLKIDANQKPLEVLKQSKMVLLKAGIRI